MSTNTEFNKIESAYSKDDFEEVINLFEKLNNINIFDLTCVEDTQILEKVASSYYHNNELNKSLYTYKKLLQHLPKLIIVSKEYHRFLDLYIISIITILAHKNKIFTDYYYLRLYMRKGGKNIEILNSEKKVEGILFTKSQEFGGVFLNIYILFIIIAFFCNYFLNSYLFVNKFYTSTFVILGLILIIFSFLSKKKMKVIFFKILNWII